MLLTQVPGYYKARRDALIQSNPGAAFIFPANPEPLRNGDVHHEYRQDSNFYYLSGFDEPEAFLLITPSKSKSGSHLTMFVRKRDLEMEMWEGERYGTEGAERVFGADEAYLNTEFDQKLPEILKAAGVDKVYYRVGMNEEMDRRIFAALEKVRKSLGRSGKSLAALSDPNEVVGEMRLFKSPAEIELMRTVCRITADAHTAAMRETKPGMNEFEVAAIVEYHFRKRGCQRLGYGSIVAGGRNSTCLHYRANNEALKDGDLLLIDAGGERDFYGADITRTFPVGKKFSKAQAQAYDLVLKSQKSAVAMAKPGAKLPEIHKHVCEILIDGMLSLGLLKGKPEEILKTNQFKRFYPHNTSHWLGMDVHDVGLYLKNGEPRALEPGMIFTIEPGFYVQPTDRDAPAEFRDIGIRIEDDILVTANGNENLTRDVPKEREEIEALRAKAY